MLLVQEAHGQFGQGQQQQRGYGDGTDQAVEYYMRQQAAAQQQGRAQMEQEREDEMYMVRRVPIPGDIVDAFFGTLHNLHTAHFSCGTYGLRGRLSRKKRQQKPRAALHQMTSALHQKMSDAGRDP